MKTITYYVLAFDTTMMLCELVLEFPKFLVNMFEHYSMTPINGKQHYFLVWEMLVSIFKLSFQCFYLYKMTNEYRFPAIFMREAVLSVVNTAALIWKYSRNFMLVSKLNKFEEVSFPEESAETCTICLNPILTGKKLHCGHIYHKDCLT